MCVMFLIELTVYKRGTSDSNTICWCNSEEGYAPANKTKHHGQRSKDECSFSNITIPPGIYPL